MSLSQTGLLLKNSAYGDHVTLPVGWHLLSQQKCLFTYIHMKWN